MLNLIIFGPPGAGKGTQAALIASQYKLIHLSSGEILRRELENGALGKKIKSYQDSGRLVPDTLIIKMIESALVKKMTGRGFIFDGYPRNLKQAKALDKFFNDHQTPINLVLNLKLSESEAAKRILLRAKTSGRSDDNLKTIQNRFQVYRTQTAPLLEYYQEQEKIINIDGRPDIKTIFENINNRLTITKKK